MTHETQEIELVDVRGGAYLDEVRALMGSYIRWLDQQLPSPDSALTERHLAEVRDLPGEYAPPGGDLVGLLVNGVMAGCVALRRHSREAAEVKRLFVSPGYRGQSLGHRLVSEVIDRATRLGYRQLLLDTLPFMHSAMKVYRHFGFSEVPAYRPGAIPGSRFLALALSPVPGAPRLVTWEPAFASEFERLNREWLEEYFHVEEKDLAVFRDPQGTIREGGGEIFFIEEGDRLVGTVAVIREADGAMELAKMAVAGEARGRGYGEWLVRTVVSYARSHGAPRLFLLSDEKLRDALRLYERVGFVRKPFPGHTGYDRGDVFMEFPL